MPYFCKKCGADTYLCQLCLREICSKDEPSTWKKIPNKSYSGSVCPICKYIIEKIEKEEVR
jgi:hypothetical protein